MRRRKTAIFLTLGFLVGICILLYPAFSNYWNSKTQSRAITDYESVLENLKPEDYTAIFEKRQEVSPHFFLFLPKVLRSPYYKPALPAARSICSVAEPAGC